VRRRSTCTAGRASAEAAYNTPLTTLRGRVGCLTAKMARQVPTMTAMDRLLCAGRAHCGGAAVGGAVAEDALAEGELPLETGVVRLGGHTTAM